MDVYWSTASGVQLTNDVLFSPIKPKKNQAFYKKANVIVYLRDGPAFNDNNTNVFNCFIFNLFFFSYNIIFIYL